MFYEQPEVHIQEDTAIVSSEDWDPTLPECREHLQRLDEWDFAVFELSDAAHGQILSQVTCNVGCCKRQSHVSILY